MRVDGTAARRRTRGLSADEKAIGADWTRMREALGINDLHFHATRHGGMSRAFAIGRDIPRAAGMDGHGSSTSLTRDTHRRQVGDGYVGWQWLGGGCERPLRRRHRPDGPDPDGERASCNGSPVSDETRASHEIGKVSLTLVPR